jgi:hypothetical protein
MDWNRTDCKEKEEEGMRMEGKEEEQMGMDGNGMDGKGMEWIRMRMKGNRGEEEENRWDRRKLP